jgi:NOL1/NOP2/fmu family ribosome biogenesis protein
MFLEQVVTQLLEHLPLAPEEVPAALDLCAAPGGKSTHLRSLLPDESLLVANEVIRSRAHILCENLTKWGHPGTVITRNDPADFGALPSCFDLILTDVPCSGEGMFRKEPAALEAWSTQNVLLCQQRQRRIVADVWPSLKPGGLLIYSTCTYNTAENEENIRWICRELGAEAVALEVPDEWHLTGNLLSGESFPVYRFFPHLTRGEGFFLAVVRRHSPIPAQSATPPSASRRTKEQSHPMSRPWLQQPAEYEWVLRGTRYTARLRRHRALTEQLERSLHVLQAGVEVGEVKGKDLVPSHALAMSSALCPDAFEHIPLDGAQATAYLRREALVLPPDAPSGYLLVTHQGVPLGFVKNIGNRANNLYPSEWRIRM